MYEGMYLIIIIILSTLKNTNEILWISHQWFPSAQSAISDFHIQYDW